MGKQNRLFDDYEDFVEKFKPKKTTDDCYTPAAVYDEVLRYVSGLTDLSGREVVRPFFPGGDYEAYDYPEGCVVVDNPPFSIYAKIVRFYLARGIDFFLFAPALTQSVSGAEVCYVVCMAEVVYENGAVVRTSFTTNLLPGKRIRVDGALAKRLSSLNPKGPGRRRQTVYPDNVLTLACCGKIATRGVCFDVGSEQCAYIAKTDNMPAGKSFFGGAFLLSERAAAERASAERAAAERAAAERAAAERAAAERAAAFVIELSEREKAMIRLLDSQAQGVV